MADILISNLDKDGEGRPFAAHGHALLANAGAISVSRGTYEPGWRWSNDVKPIAGTESCQVHHQGLSLSGSMTIRRWSRRPPVGARAPAPTGCGGCSTPGWSSPGSSPATT